jgi:hypothetical protein
MAGRPVWKELQSSVGHQDPVARSQAATTNQLDVRAFARLRPAHVLLTSQARSPLICRDQGVELPHAEGGRRFPLLLCLFKQNVPKDRCMDRCSRAGNGEYETVLVPAWFPTRCSPGPAREPGLQARCCISLAGRQGSRLVARICDDVCWLSRPVSPGWPLLDPTAADLARQVMSALSRDGTGPLLLVLHSYQSSNWHLR